LLDLFNKIEDSRDECSFKPIKKAGNLMPFRELADSVESIFVAIVALFPL
jgi:hypothetical protein